MAPAEKEHLIIKQLSLSLVWLFLVSGMVSAAAVPLGEPLTVRAVVRNEGPVAAEEVVQLYVRDLAGQVTRPVRELKGFQRVRLAPGESRTIVFQLRPVTEAGAFHAWIGGSSEADLQAEFNIVESTEPSPVMAE